MMGCIQKIDACFTPHWLPPGLTLRIDLDRPAEALSAAGALDGVIGAW